MGQFLDVRGSLCGKRAMLKGSPMPISPHSPRFTFQEAGSVSGKGGIT